MGGMNPSKETLDALRINRANSRRSNPVGALVAIVLTAGAVIAGMLWWFNRPRVTVVSTTLVQEATTNTDNVLLNASGYVTARRAATVSSKVTGKVVEILVEEGMHVESNQVLARLDSSNLEKSHQLAEARLESARKTCDETRATLEQAERDLQRVSRLAANRTVSKTELERAETEVTSTSARLERQTADVTVSEREVAIWKQQLDDTIIRAPFDGVVTSKDAQPGEMVSPVSAGGGFIRTGICTVVDMNSLEIEVDVSESYINRVQSHQPVEATLDSYPNWHIPAKVIAIVPTADRQKATVRVRVGFEELDARILPEMSVKVAFQSGTQRKTPERLIRLPKTAVRQHEGQNIVWIVHESRLERRAVTVDVRGDDEVTIAAGINGGERVVLEGPEDLAEGAQVKEAKSER